MIFGTAPMDICIGEGGQDNPDAYFVPSPGNAEMVHDPEFVDPSNLDFDLQSVSPCIDRGTDFGYGFNSFESRSWC